ncbi:hypothetical protein DPMN_038714 [Dreissena polymorpha]|uniref:Uncharacterized protein n=1 Tax=Dreissena polymorpha TaxID=45954 RepID=A0A9D4MER0_DREPO|nr:hypothetical protein DPMN_038714 [Dreissena polymorpha]
MAGNLDDMFSKKNTCNWFKASIELIITKQGLEKYSNPSWKNTRAELWATNHWEIAKCYLPPDGYTDIASVQGTDFNGVISILLNCTHFDTCFSFSNAPSSPYPECIVTQVRQIGRDVRHTSSCQVADSDLKNIILKLQSLLTNPVSLANDPNASSAINTLRKLKNNTQFITPDELLEHLKDAQQILVKVNDQSERVSKEVDTVLLEIDTHMKQCLQQI